MRTHKLKILNDFADEVVAGEKTFEIRKNDKGYQKGDFIKFQAVDETGFENQHLINDKLYEITFVLNGWGLENGYVALAIKNNPPIKLASFTFEHNDGDQIWTDVTTFYKNPDGSYKKTFLCGYYGMENEEVTFKEDILSEILKAKTSHHQLSSKNCRGGYAILQDLPEGEW